MANNPNPDRDVEYMRKMWGTEGLVTDYGDWGKEKPKKKVIQEIMNDDSEDFLQEWLNIRRLYYPHTCL